MGAIYIGIDSELTKLENGSWTCQPSSTFPINPQSRTLCAPEFGLIDHWRSVKWAGIKGTGHRTGHRQTTRYVTINAQQGAQYLSIYDRSVKLYNACMDGFGYERRTYEWTHLLSGPNRIVINECSAHYFGRGLYTTDDIDDIDTELREELRVFFRQFPIIKDKRPRWWIDLQFKTSIFFKRGFFYGDWFDKIT